MPRGPKGGKRKQTFRLTTGGHSVYLDAVAGAFGAHVDHAMLIKLHGEGPGAGEERKCSPGECIGTCKEPKIGLPALANVSTSHVERSNLSCARA